MSDETPAAAPEQTTTAEPIAGKFADVGAFEKGAAELMSNLGIPAPIEGQSLVNDWHNGNIDSAVEYYKSLESIQGKTGGQKPEAPATETPEQPEAEATTEARESLKLEPTAEKQIGTLEGLLGELELAPDDLAETWKNDGKLTDDQYAKFETKGYTKEMVDTFISGEAAKAELAQVRMQQLQSEGIKAAGGQEQFNVLAKWAETNLNADELKHYNSLVDGPNASAESVKMGMEWLNGRYAARTDTAGSKPTVGGTPAPSSPGVSTTKEYHALLREMDARAQAGEDITALEAKMLATPEHIRNGMPY